MTCFECFRIWTKLCVFSSKRVSLRRKLSRLRDGVILIGIVALESNLSRTALELEERLPGDFLSFSADAVLLGALEPLHESDLFLSHVLRCFCVLQLSRRRSQWNCGTVLHQS